MAGKISADEKRWQAESDAETMVRYQEIMQDKSRRTAAIKAAQEKADALSKRMRAMQAITKGNNNKK